MIVLLEPLPIGNAVRVLLQPPAEASAWKVLRKESDDFAGHSDPAAVVVGEGENCFIDARALMNGTGYFYQAYAKVDGTWSDSGESKSATPAMTAGETGPDALEIVRDRLEWGLKELCDQGVLTHKNGAIPVFSAPPIFEEAAFPIVTVHLASQKRFASGVGELIAADVFDDDAGQWIDSEGQLWAITLTIATWAVANPDVRIALRKAINRLLLGNLPVFSDAGLSEVEFTAIDTEDFESYGAPVYQTFFTLSCVAAHAVQSASPPVGDVIVTADAA